VIEFRPPHPDLLLVQGCLAGDRAAWEALFRRHEATVFHALRCAFRLRGFEAPHHLLQELEAEVFFRLVRDDFAKLRQYSGRCSIKSWLKVVSGNRAVDFLRQQRSTLSLDAPEAQSLVAPEARPDERLDRAETRALLRELYQELSGDDRRFVELFYLEELPFEEVAARLGTSLGALYNRKCRLHKRLAQELLRRQTLTERRRRRVSKG
jgi:RNA polymerase sigma factor (sigma-70 family)